MLKQTLISKKIEQARKALEGFETREQEFTVRKEDLETAITEAETDEEIEAVSDSVEKLEKEQEDLAEEKTKLEGEIKELEGQLEKMNSKAPSNDVRSKRGESMETREGISNYVRSRGKTREGFTSVEGGALIPEEILKPEEGKRDILDLSKSVRVVKANSGSGTYPLIKKSGAVFSSVEELKKNPELTEPKIEEIDYKIKTYRGYIPISQEVIDDADYDVTGMIRDEINDQDLNTKNAKIAEILKTATPVEAEGLDGLKDIINTKLKKVYNVQAKISASMYNELDKLKDKNGKYILQDNVTAESGKKLFGLIDIEVLDDEMIGTAKGDLVGFIGDTHEFVTLFDRKQASVKWTDNNIYGELLAGMIRFDTKKTDEEAGFYVTFKPEVIA